MELHRTESLSNIADMTTDDIRTYFATAALPQAITPAPWLRIEDVPRFVALHLERLDSECPRLRMLAEKNLKALYRSLHTTP